MLDFTLGFRPSAVFFGGHLKGLEQGLASSSMSLPMSLETKLIFESKLTRFRSRDFCFCFFFLFLLAKMLDLTRGLFLTTLLGLVGLGGRVGGCVGLGVGLLGTVGLGLRGRGL